MDAFDTIDLDLNEDGFLPGTNLADRTRAIIRARSSTYAMHNVIEWRILVGSDYDGPDLPPGTESIRLLYFEKPNSNQMVFYEHRARDSTRPRGYSYRPFKSVHLTGSDQLIPEEFLPSK